MVNLLRTVRLGQSILKRKFPSVAKGPLKNLSPRAFFSEFYGILEGSKNPSSNFHP